MDAQEFFSDYDGNSTGIRIPDVTLSHLYMLWRLPGDMTIRELSRHLLEGRLVDTGYPDAPLQERLDWMRTRIEFEGVDGLDTFTCYDTETSELEAALILDGVTSYTVTSLDSFKDFVFDKWRVWWEGSKRHYRHLSHENIVAVMLVPAGTMPDTD